MKEIYQLNKEELFRTCGNPEGLTTTDAKERLQTYGENTLVEQKKQSVASVFFHQFADLLVIILIAAAIVSMASGNIESTIVIFAVIIMNAILGTIQYVKNYLHQKRKYYVTESNRRLHQKTSYRETSCS